MCWKVCQPALTGFISNSSSSYSGSIYICAPAHLLGSMHPLYLCYFLISHGQQPVRARAGLRAGHCNVSQSSQARLASPSAHAARKVAARARDAVDTQSNQKQRPAQHRLGLRAGSQSSAPFQTVRRSSRSNPCNDSQEQGSMHPRSAAISVRQQSAAAGSDGWGLLHTPRLSPLRVARSQVSSGQI